MITALLALAAAATAPNLVFVTIDTLRADHVGAYGSPAASTLTLDRLAREGVLFEDAVVQVPQTRPSHVSLFTGRYPYEHGIRDNYSPRLDAKVPTLATLFRRQGYSTAAFVGAYPVSRSSGLDQGFLVYDDPFGEGENSTTDDSHLERPAGQVVDAALQWLKNRPAGPFFVWIHLFDPHAPHLPPEPYGKRFAKNPYDGEIAYADAQLGRLVQWLDAQGLRQSTPVVVTSDHGEGLGDHGENEHLVFLYDSTLKVPAIVSWPGRLAPGSRIKGQMRSIDFVATLLDLLGLPPAETSGASRADAVRSGGRIPDNESYAEAIYGQLHFGWAPLRALRGEGWKLVDAPRPELYRLADDPGELQNLMETRPQVATAMRSRLSSYDKARTVAVAAPLDPAAAERLAALGYVGGGFFRGEASGADPKDKIRDYQAYQKDVADALRLYRDRDVEGALRILTRLARPGTTESGQVLENRSFNVEYTLGRALVDKKRFAEAVPHLEKAVELLPTSIPAYVHLAQAYGGARGLPEAAAAIDRGLVRAPANSQLLQAKGSLQLRQGDYAGARRTLEKARDRDPRSALVRVDLATVYRSQGELATAKVEADEAVRLAPKLPEAQVALGLVLGALGREGEAAAAFQEALGQSKDHPDALFYLGAIYLRAGRPQQALPLLERLVTSAPQYPGGGEALLAARAALPSAASDGGRVRLQLLRTPDRRLADGLARRIAAGEDFGGLARAHSVDPSADRGGDLGLVRVPDLAEPLRSAAAKLRPGETSALLETERGFVLLRRLP